MGLDEETSAGGGGQVHDGIGVSSGGEGDGYVLVAHFRGQVGCVPCC